MTRWQVYLVLALGIFALGLGAGLSWGAHRVAGEAQAAQAQSDQHAGAAQAHAAQAQALTTQGAVADASEVNAEASVATAKRDLDAARARLETVPLTSASASGSALPPVPALPSAAPDLGLIIAKQDAVIVAQDHQITALKLQVSIAKAEAAQWHAAYDESQKALALERISKDAVIRSETRRGWLHTLGGVAIGALAGRLSR
jgi:hypothetical protein